MNQKQPENEISLNDFDRWFVDLRIQIVCSLLNDQRYTISDIVECLRIRRFRGAYSGAMPRMIWLCCLEMMSWGWIETNETPTIRRGECIPQRIVWLAPTFAGHK